MLSQTLAAYQTAWLAFWSNTAFTIASISNCFEGCQMNEINEIASLEQANSHRSDLISKIDEQSKNGAEQDLLLLNDAEEARESEQISERTGNELTARLQKEHELEKEIDLINIDDSMELDLFSDGNSLIGGSSKNSQEQQMRKKQVDDLLTSSANSEDLILLDDILKWSSSESSFANSLSSVGQSLGQLDQLVPFSFTRSDEPSKLFGFGSKGKQPDQPDEQQTSRSQSKSETEKKKWADLFADIDVFNQKNGKKGDC